MAHIHINFFFFCFVKTARAGSRVMQSLTPEERASSVNTLADLLITKQAQILEANAKDLDEGTKSGLAKPLLSRLSLTPAKLKSLSTGLKQIADSSLQVKFCILFKNKFVERKWNKIRNAQRETVSLLAIHAIWILRWIMKSHLTWIIRFSVFWPLKP